GWGGGGGGRAGGGGGRRAWGGPVVAGGRAGVGRAGRGERGGKEQEGRVWGPADPAVERDQLFERAAFVERGIIEAADHDIGHVLEAIGAEEMSRRVWREGRERVIAVDPAVGKVVRPVAA